MSTIVGTSTKCMLQCHKQKQWSNGRKTIARDSIVTPTPTDQLSHWLLGNSIYKCDLKPPTITVRWVYIVPATIVWRCFLSITLHALRFVKNIGNILFLKHRRNVIIKFSIMADKDASTFTVNTLLLPMAWICNEIGHQQPWHWLGSHEIDRFQSQKGQIIGGSQGNAFNERN